MSRTIYTTFFASSLLGASAAFADVPQVAVDIAPLHSLVTRVMDGVGTPDLIVPAGASPHEYNLRPSEAAALQDADVIFVIGEDLSPWLENALETLAGDAAVTEFLHSDATRLLDIREGALFEAHVHDEHEDHDEHMDEDPDEHEGEEHDDHADEDHEEHADDDHDDHEGHDHGDHDPHVWLSPENAKAWMNVIAAELSAADPDNAGTYFANAAAGQAELDTLIAEVNGILAPARGMNFIVFHDAYQYFEVSFDFPAAGAISVSDAAEPGPARIAEIRDRLREEGVDCVLTEPQFNPGLVAAILDGTEAGTAVIDPLGATLTPGSQLYPDLIRGMATVLAGC